MQPIFWLIDVSITNKDEMCGASQLVAIEHNGLIKNKMPFTFQLIVESKQVHQRKQQIFWSTLCHLIPFQIMGPTNTNQALLDW